MKLEFTKMHGLGNDFILIDCMQSPGRDMGSASLSGLAQKLCHRRFGIGADQLLLLDASGIADFRMRIFNADGSEVEMCGNGIRCLARYVWDRSLSSKKTLEVETLAGIIRPEEADGLVRVDMGAPVFDPGKIPVNIVQSSAFNVQRTGKGQSAQVIDYPLRVDDRDLKMTCVSMGNPHAVIFVDNVSEFPVAYYGPMIENHPLFPRRTNVEFVEVLNASEIRMRVWERGTGETMACGTGASASAVATHIRGLAGKSVTVHLNGGDLSVLWAENDHVYMTGPAVEVFTGSVAL